MTMDHRNSYLQEQFLAILSAKQPTGYKVIQLGVLLTKGFIREVNRPIPSLQKTPLQYCVETLSDTDIDLIEGLLPYVDLSYRDPFGLTVFNSIVPVPWGKKDIFLRMLEYLHDEDRKWMIIKSAMSAKSVVGNALVDVMIMMNLERTGQMPLDLSQE